MSGMDVVVKKLLQTESVWTIAVGRYALGALVTSVVWHLSGRPLVTFRAMRQHALRGLVIAVTAWSFFFSLGKIPLAFAITLSFLAPLLIPFSAWAIVGERPRSQNLIATGLGFVGAAIATFDPAGGLTASDKLGIASALVSAVAYAISTALLRKRAAQDGAPVIGLLQTVFPGLFLLPPTLVWGNLPAASSLPWFLLMGVIGASGWYLTIHAYGRAEAQKLAPIEFTALVWGALSGRLLYGEPIRPRVVAGALVIVAACLWAAKRAENA